MAEADPASAPAGFAEIADAPPTATCWKCRGLPRDSACRVCGGTGYVPRAKPKTKPTRAAKLYPSYSPPGPLPLAPELPELCVKDDEDLSYLIGHWRIFQNKAQHRYSTDDVVTAWVAYRMGPLLYAARKRAAAAAGSPASDATTSDGDTPLRSIDIGCGIGSVVLMTAWLYPHALCLGVEAQPTRFSQAVRSVAYNGVGERVALVNGDLRDPSVAPSERFDLVTGTPPYFDVMTGGTPDDAESARCLFEFRGGIEEYCKAAARLLARPHGIFIVVETAQAVERTYVAAAAAGLRVLARVDIVPREGKPVLINVFVMAATPAYEDVEAPDAASPLDGAAATWIPPNTFAPDGRGPYDVTGSNEAAESVAPAAGGASSTASSVAPAAVEESGAAASAPPEEGGASSAAAPAAAASAAPQGPKRKRAQVQPGKPMPAAQPGELVVSIPVRDVRGERTVPYRLLLQELGKPG